MHPKAEYEGVIFDCDGVIFDSNRMKIRAMKYALEISGYPKEHLSHALAHFENNFGQSRYKHIDHFVDVIARYSATEASEIKSRIVQKYSHLCLDLYKRASIAEGLEKYIAWLNCPKFVASGSDQSELRKIFIARGLEGLFEGIYGSPTSKAENVANIIQKFNLSRVLMIGDAESDFMAARSTNIDFVFYSPFSTVQETMMKLSEIHGFPVVQKFEELMCE